MKQICLILALIILYNKVLCQQSYTKYIDSLKKELPKSAADSNQVKILDMLAYTYSNINPDSGIKYALQALQVAQNAKWEKGIALANTELGINYGKKSAYDKAIGYHQQALSIYQKLNKQKSIAAVSSNIALMHQSLGNYPLALEYNYNAARIAEKLREDHMLAMVNENIGTIFLEQKDHTKALEYYNKANTIYKLKNDKKGIARNLTNIGIVLDANKNYKAALDNQQKAYAINKELGDMNGMQINCANIGIVYTHMDMPEKSLEYYTKALQISTEMGALGNNAINMGNLGEAHYSIAKKIKQQQGESPIYKDHLQKAIQYLKDAVTLCEQINYMAPATEFLPFLSDIYNDAGLYKDALLTYKKYITVKDKVFSNESKTALSTIENKREIELTQKDIALKDKQLRIAALELKQKKNERAMYLMGVALLIMGFVVVVNSIRVYKNKNRMLALENKRKTNIIFDQLKAITKRNAMLEEIATKYSHDIRGHVATILGLSQLVDKDNYTSPQNEKIVEGIIETTEKLDGIIKQVVAEENKLIRDKE